MQKRFKIVLFRNIIPYTTAYYYYKALKRMDIDLIDVPFDPYKPQPDTPFPEGDLLLLIDCGLPVDFPGLNRYKGPRGFISIDSCHKLKIHKAYYDKYRFEYIWVAQKHLVGEFGPDAIWLPLAADEEIHVYREEMARGEKLWDRVVRRNHYDIGMCAAPYKHRREFEKLFKGAGLTTLFYFRKKFGEEATRETARCTIGFNVGAGYTGEKGKDINMRVFETMANGKAMLLTNIYDNLGYEELFEEGKHYIGFRTTAEAVEKALFCAQHPEGALRIAKEGQAHILANHTYTHRCREILSILEKGDKER